ncbi:MULTISPECIES: hypothetical protein [Bacteria]|uniref:deoxynucleotide monophosphate kinase family protein n=1 Tax=Bacteria TaxID=2 RepID=UPI003C7D6505
MTADYPIIKPTTPGLYAPKSDAPLVGLLGKKRSGKNTAASRLADHGYAVAAFADPLRDMALAIDPVVGVHVEDARGGHHLVHYVTYSEALAEHGYERAKEEYPEFRRFLQRLGTEGVRDTLGAKHGLREILGDDVWIVLAEHRIQKAAAEGEALVFTDVRFPNEAELIERKGGTTVRVVRPDLDAAEDTHSSETALDDFVDNRRIVNDGTLSDLSTEVDELVSSL